MSDPRAVPPSDRPGIRVSVVVPAYGEERRIGATVLQLRQALVPLAAAGQVEIVVVDDGSVDRTSEAAEAAGADRIIRFAANRGKGAAVRAGMLVAGGDTVAFTDADLSYPPVQLLRLVAEVEDGWDVVVGSRRHIDTTTHVRPARSREVSGRVFNLLTRLVLAQSYGDTQCGIKAFRRPAAQKLFSAGRIDGFAFDVELFFLAARYGLTVREVPVELASAAGSTVRLATDSVRMIRDLWGIRRSAALGVYDTVLAGRPLRP